MIAPNTGVHPRRQLILRGALRHDLRKALILAHDLHQPLFGLGGVHRLCLGSNVLRFIAILLGVRHLNEIVGLRLRVAPVSG